MISKDLEQKYINLSPASRQIEFGICCKNGNLDAVNFFLTSPKLDRHVDVHYDHDVAFLNACIWGKYNIVKYLIVDYGIKQNEKLKMFLKIQSPLALSHCTVEAIELFEKRDFHKALEQTLNQSLVSGEEKVKKPKL